MLSGCTTNSNNSIDTGEDFSFTDVEGIQRNLSDYRGKIVVMDMWATWCQPCHYQMLELKYLYENYSKNILEIISINIDTKESVSDIKDFLDAYREYGYDFNWVFGNDDNGNIWKNYKQSKESIPTLIIFDGNGESVFSHEGVAFYSKAPPGYSDATFLSEEIEKIINK